MYAVIALPLQFRVTGKDIGKVFNKSCTASNLTPLKEFRAPKKQMDSYLFMFQLGCSGNLEHLQPISISPKKFYCLAMHTIATKAKLTKVARVSIQRTILTRRASIQRTILTHRYVGGSKKEHHRRHVRKWGLSHCFNCAPTNINLREYREWGFRRKKLYK